MQDADPPDHEPDDAVPVLIAPHPAGEDHVAAEPLVTPSVLAPRRGGWLVWALLAVLAALAVFGWRANEGIEASFAEQEAFVEAAQQAFETVPLLSDDEIATLRRSRNAAHVSRAQDLGVPPPDTRAEADSLADRYALVPISTDSLYTVLPGEYSVPVLTPSAAASLDRIAVRFREKLEAEGLPPFRFAVSSVWRTGADQAALRGDNVNAAAGRSSHEYATTYDITYNPTRYSPAPDALPPPPRIDPRVPRPMRGMVRESLVQRQFDDLNALAADYPSRLTALLGRALIELEDEGVVLVVRERRQPVFHITVGKRLL